MALEITDVQRLLQLREKFKSKPRRWEGAAKDWMEQLIKKEEAIKARKKREGERKCLN